MTYRILADFLVVLHLGFVLFVCLGGLLVLRWHRMAWVHLPAAVWGAIRGDKLRVISARDMIRREQKEYEGARIQELEAGPEV